MIIGGGSLTIGIINCDPSSGADKTVTVHATTDTTEPESSK